MASSRYSRPFSGRMAPIVTLAILLTLASPVSAAGPPAGVSTEEWATIQTQIEAELHKVVESDRLGRLYRADNPAQRFIAHFGAEDVLITPRGRGEPEWQIGLRLTAWGAAHDLQPVPPAGAIAEGNRVEYRRGPLTEWYVNTRMGLEQGFTIEHPPGDGITEFVLEITIGGDLTAELAGSGHVVAFRREGGDAFLTYYGLEAWDAVDTPLEARMQCMVSEKKLRLVVNLADVVWPVTIDPIFAQIEKLLPTKRVNTEAAHFGRAVAIDGDVMVVGMNDLDRGEETGAAHVYRRDQGGSGNWGHVKKITAPDGAAYDYFARSVDISGDTIIVGSDQDDDNGTNSGSAYIFRRNQGGIDAWGQVAKLAASVGMPYDHFGRSVAISGDTAVVGAPDEDGAEPNSGMAHVFRRDLGGPDAWGHDTMIAAADGAGSDSFGESVAIANDTIVVGSPDDDDLGDGSGAAYIFRREMGGSFAWGQVAKIQASNGGKFDHFGASVAISADTVLVGAPSANGHGPASGSAYIFGRDHGGLEAWAQIAVLVPSDPESGDIFGDSLSIDGGTAIIGAERDQTDGSDAGSASVFLRDQGGIDAWGQVARIVPNDIEKWDSFGFAVAISGETAVVGSWADDDHGANSGSVYVFTGNSSAPDSWEQTRKIATPAVLGARWDNFGASVAVSGDTAIVGAPTDEYDDSGWGAAYVFGRDRGVDSMWRLVTKITHDDGTIDDRFGVSVAVDGNTAVVGADFLGSSEPHAGAVYVFERDRGGPDHWGQTAKIIASDGAPFHMFGQALSISGDTIIVGAKWNGLGSAYIYRRDPGGSGAWSEVARVVPSSGTDSGYGSSASVSGDTAIVGYWADDHFGLGAGAAYIYRRDQGGPDAWGEVTKIGADDPLMLGFFGRSVAISGDTAFVGSPGDSALGSRSGSVYVFGRDVGGTDNWGQIDKILASDGGPGDEFGSRVDIAGERAVVGAAGNDGDVINSGSAYLFARNEGSPETWIQVAKIGAADAARDDRFGAAVAVGPDIVLVGAPDKGDLGELSGAAYIYAPSNLRASPGAQRRVPDEPSP